MQKKVNYNKSEDTVFVATVVVEMLKEPFIIFFFRNRGYLSCCQQYPLVFAERLHLDPFLVVALHWELVVGFALVTPDEFFFLQAPQLPPPAQYLQLEQFEQAGQGSLPVHFAAVLLQHLSWPRE